MTNHPAKRSAISPFNLFAGVLSSLALLASPASAQEPPPAEQAREALPDDPAQNSQGSGSINPQSLKIAGEIVDLGFPVDTREAIFFASMDQMVFQMREAIEPTLPKDDPGAITILDEWILEYIGTTKGILQKHIPDIMEGMTRAYAQMFTIEELADIRAFVATPSGQRFFELSPAIIATDSFAEPNQAYMNEVMAGMPEAQRALMDRLVEYTAQKEQNEPQPDT